MIAEIEPNYDIFIFLENEKELRDVLAGKRLEDKIVDKSSFRLGNLGLEIDSEKVFGLKGVSGFGVEGLWADTFGAIVYINEEVCEGLRKNSRYGGRYSQGFDGSKVSIKLVDSKTERFEIDFLREIIQRWDEYVRINSNR